MSKHSSWTDSPKTAGFDQERLAEIYDIYHLPIYHTIYRQVADLESAQDLTSDVFFRLLQAINKGKGPDQNVKAWLYRCAHNIVVDYYRRQRFRRHLPMVKNLPCLAPEPDQITETKIIVSRTRKALRALSPNQRQVITLKYLDGLNNQDIAAIMGKSIGAVKSLQHRGLVSLRRQLHAADHSHGSISAIDLAMRVPT